MASLAISGCGGEANYSFADVQRLSFNFFNGDITFTSRNKVYVATTDSNVLTLQTDSTENLTFSIVGGEDSALFKIDKVTGKLTFIEKPLFQNGGNNIYEVVVATEDSAGNRAIQVIEVEVVEDITVIAPVVYTTLKNYEISSFIGVVFQLDADAADGQGALSYVLDGVDKTLFTVDDNGNVRFVQNEAEASGKTTFNIDVLVTDGYGNTTLFSGVTVVKVASSSEIHPVIISQHFKIVENSLGNIPVVVYKAEDAEITAYTLSGGDAALFEVKQGRLLLKESKDFELSSGALGFTMQVEDSHGQKSEAVTVRVEIIDIDEKFNFIGIHDQAVEEGYTGIVTIIEAVANTLSVGIEKQFSLVQGSSYFSIDAAGAISFKNPAQIDDNITVQVAVESQLNGSRTLSEPFQVVVVDDPAKIPPSIDNNYLRTVTIVETQSVILSIQATPNGSSTTLSYLLTGTDTAKFTIDDQGTVTLNTTYVEGLSNIYTFAVVITDDNDNTVTTDTISVTLLQDPDKIRPVINSTTFNIVENSTGNMNVLIVSDGNGVVDTYNVTGADAALFTFDGNGLRFNIGADFELHASNAGTNSYSVTLQVEDSLGNISDEKNIVVAVTDVDETLQFTSLSSFTPTENTTAVGTIMANGKDETVVSVTYTLHNHTDIFTLDPSTGSLNFKSPAIVSEHYELNISAQSQFNGSLTFSPTVTVDVVALSYAITFTSQDVATLPQNSVVNVPIFAVSAAARPITYAMDDGTDPSIFSIDAVTGMMTVHVPAYTFSSDPEANIYRGAVVASDDLNHSAIQQGELHIEVVNGIPEFMTSANLNVNENNKAIVQLTATSPIGSSLTYSKVSGADVAFFNVTSDGLLTFNVARNFEDPQDANQDNVYEVDIRVTDTLYSVNTAVQHFVVQIADTADAPTNIVFASSGTLSASVNDGTSFFGIISNKVTDLYLSATASPSNGALYSTIVTNPNSSIFSMNTNGVLRVDAPPVSSNITYDIVIAVSEDKGETTTVTMHVTILD